MRRFEETDSPYPIPKVLGWDSELELEAHPESSCTKGAKSGTELNRVEGA
jgi:hypothetical protein